MGMKRSFSLAAAGSVCLMGSALGDGFADDFESYSLGENNLSGQSTWAEWCNGGGFVDASVVLDPAGGSNKVIRNDSGDDVVHGLDATEGQWLLSVDVYVPAFTLQGFTNTGVGYVIGLNQYDLTCTGGPINWSLTTTFDGFTQQVQDTDNGNVAPLALDEWGTFIVEVDLDADTVSVTWNQGGNSTLITDNENWSNHGGIPGLPQFEVLDLFSGSAEIYYDNVSMKPVGAASQAATAVDVTRTLGIFISGDLAAISTSDDVDYVLQTGPGFNPAEPHPARVDVGFDTGGFAASTVDATIEVGSNIGGPTAVVLLQNFTTGAFDEIGRGSFGPGDTTTTYAGVPAGDYINGANRAVVRVRSFFIIVLFPTVRGFTNHDFIGLNMNG